MVGIYRDEKLYDCGAWDDCPAIREAVRDYPTFLTLHTLGRMRVGGATEVAHKFNQQKDNVLLWEQEAEAVVNHDTVVN